MVLRTAKRKNEVNVPWMEDGEVARVVRVPSCTEVQARRGVFGSEVGMVAR